MNTKTGSGASGGQRVTVVVESSVGAVLRVERIVLTGADRRGLTSDVVSIGNGGKPVDSEASRRVSEEA